MKSCTYLQSALYIAPDDVRTCCQRFFVDGELKGDVSLNLSPEQGELSFEAVVEAKKELVKRINNGSDTRCDGCPHLKKADWEPIEQESIKYISFEYHSVCNMKCTYCSELYYGGVRPKFDIMKFGASVERVSPDLHIAWGGGEPTALRDFETVFSFAQDRFQPYTQRVFTNALKYSPVIQEALDKRRTSITTSIDAGTQSTFEKVRRSSGLQKVLFNLEKYSRASPDLVTVKYIFVSENHSRADLDGFVEKIQSFNLEKCSFLLSTDFKIEKDIFSYLDSIMYLFFRLQEVGAAAVSLDDHIFARLKERGFSSLRSADSSDQDRKFIQDKIEASLNSFSGSDVILWGTGKFASNLLTNKSFRQNFNVVKIVDPNKNRHGQDFYGYEIQPTTEVQSSDTNIVIGSVNFFGEITNTLKCMGVDRKRVVPPFLVY